MHRYLPLCLIVALLIAFRTLGSALPEILPNSQPLAALFFCGALLAPGWRGYAIPLGVWAVTFPQGIGHTGYAQFLTTLIAITAIFLLGKSLSTRNIPTLLVGSITAALSFHLITNGMAWLADPRYSKTLAGLMQSLWFGLPGDVLPSWVFLRNMTAANFLFTGIFLLSRLSLPKVPASAPTPVKSR